VAYKLLDFPQKQSVDFALFYNEVGFVFVRHRFGLSWSASTAIGGKSTI
jgi:hypothetical protein